MRSPSPNRYYALKNHSPKTNNCFLWLYYGFVQKFTCYFWVRWYCYCLQSPPPLGFGLYSSPTLGKSENIKLWFTSIRTKCFQGGFLSVFHRFFRMCHDFLRFWPFQISQLPGPRALSCSISASRLMARKATPCWDVPEVFSVRNEVWGFLKWWYPNSYIDGL